MDFFYVYQLGRAFPLVPGVASTQQKLDDIYFEYSSREINSTVAIVFVLVLTVYYFLSILVSLFGIGGTLPMVFLFLGSILALILYVYPQNIYYSQVVMQYQEQMFRSILSLSNYVSMNTSLEYAFYHTAPMIKGVLSREFNTVLYSLQRKETTSFGEAIEGYIQKWNRFNETFVKALRLLQTALMADEQDKDKILQETTDTLMMNFKVKGKRSAEDLANKAKGLISFGIMLPVMSLMLLPLISIFLTGVVTPGRIFFLYCIVFPTVMLLMALNFAYKRVQIDTVHLEDSPYYKPLPTMLYIVSLGCMVLLSIPGILHLGSIDMSTAEGAAREYSFAAVFKVWLISLGIVLGVFILVRYYIYLHEKDWRDIKAAEDDLPHLLQIFSTYLSLNTPLENIVPKVSSDYREEGFSDHPIVRIFSEVSRKMKYTKGRIQDLLRDTLNEVCPSRKVSNTLGQIATFSEISQESGTKATKLIRSQSISTMELDDYIRTLLAETTGLISISVTMLLPLLSAVAVIMSVLIVKSINYITEELKNISASMGGGGEAMAGLNIINITEIIPPTLLQIIICIYFLEMFYILSLFGTKIEIGDDRFQLAKKINSNLVSFMVFSLILLGGHFVVNSMFSGYLGT